MLQEYRRRWDWGKGVGSLSFDVQGRGSLAQFGPIRTEKMGGGGGRGCKTWTFFMDVINVWSLLSISHCVDISYVFLYLIFRPFVFIDKIKTVTLFITYTHL